MKTLDELARMLGGDLSGCWINIRGPNHSKKDRSLGILFNPAAPDGFWVHSLAGDDQTVCRHYVLELIQKIAPDPGTEVCVATDQDTCARAKIDRALALWEE